MHLANESRGAAAGKEQAFFQTVLLQRDQELRMEQIRRSALAPKSKQRRQAETEAKAKMLAESQVGAAPVPDEAMVKVSVLPGEDKASPETTTGPPQEGEGEGSLPTAQALA